MAQTHEQYVEIVKNAATQMAKKAILEFLLKKFAFLAWGPLAVIVEKLVTELAEYLIKTGEFAIFFKYIDLRVDAQGRDFTSAAINNYKIQQTGTPDERAKAELELAQKFKDFISFKS